MKLLATILLFVVIQAEAATNSYILGPVQKDGRRFVREILYDSQSVQFLIDYLANSGTDYDALLIIHASQIAQQVKDNEIARILGTLPSTIVLKYNTAAELATAFRLEYQAATSYRACQLAAWITGLIDSGAVTITQVRNAFGYTVNQYNAMRARMDALVVTWNNMQASTGE